MRSACEEATPNQVLLTDVRILFNGGSVELHMYGQEKECMSIYHKTSSTSFFESSY